MGRARDGGCVVVSVNERAAIWPAASRWLWGFGILCEQQSVVHSPSQGRGYIKNKHGLDTVPHKLTVTAVLQTPGRMGNALMNVG